jgi:hypothetical protein
MAIDPRRILAQVGLRILHLDGTDHDDLEESYSTANLESVMDGSDVPYSALVDTVLASEAFLADLVAGDKHNPHRAALYGRSSDLASGALVPANTNGGIEFIGVYSQLSDATDNMPLQEAPIQQIRRHLRGGYSVEIYQYALVGGRVYHTRDNAYFEGCAFSRTAALARMDSSSEDLSPLPAALEGAWVAHAIASLPQEGWLANEAGYYAEFAANAIGLLRQRNLELPALPSAQATPRPAID